MTGVRVLSVFLTLCLCGFSVAKDHVPVLIWNPNQHQGGVPSVSALQHISYATFNAKYLASFKPNNILLFLQDALSIEDLTGHTSELHHVKEWMESGHSLFLPNVEDAARLVHDLPAHGYNVLKLDHDAGLSMKQEDKNLVVVELPSTETNPSRRRALQKADEVMENVISKIGKQRDFTIIFTGKKPSVDERNDQYDQRIRVSRSLQAVQETINVTGYHFSECTKMYLRQNLTVLMPKDGTKVPYMIDENSSLSNNTGDCRTDFNSLHVKYFNIDIGGTTYSKVYVTYNFQLKRGPSWVLESVSISTDTEVANQFFSLETPMDSVPKGMSFACSEKFVFKANGTFLGVDNVELVLERFQMEAFNRGDKFGGAWDCVGFFTVPIWCGLLSTLILVIILTMGLFMLSDIKTMDRFDDPKAQPLNVPAAD
ncbi:V-type proton ATPase subunit S1-like [Macrobrachium nipponense]|uniref:V-type proton ATPase subunit S1-like n=1 Tax=Macrobrachium nipponense TaxID=159736 RepID=UPI0030C7E31B